MYEKRVPSVKQFENALERNDIFVDLTIHDIPASLLEDFGKQVINRVYAGQLNEAIKDMMRKAILKQKLAANK